MRSTVFGLVAAAAIAGCSSSEKLQETLPAPDGRVVAKLYVDEDDGPEARVVLHYQDDSGLEDWNTVFTSVGGKPNDIHWVGNLLVIASCGAKLTEAENVPDLPPHPKDGVRPVVRLQVVTEPSATVAGVSYCAAPTTASAKGAARR